MMRTCEIKRWLCARRGHRVHSSGTCACGDVTIVDVIRLSVHRVKVRLPLRVRWRYWRMTRKLTPEQREATDAAVAELERQVLGL